eukprot:CAMPEP_0174889408 /NCGR_PEP_ID=MMETSP0167-20121228/4663_1 /TAXON_ID=38298 /ORGANISM="Rhodella maculata, Strain CCMP736" /LENGTH=103 /DNA_ID=CAMNT_0016126801 /DNA_START=56 /DNA_END=364 /DNA_ORIENTATION=+
MAYQPLRPIARFAHGAPLSCPGGARTEVRVDAEIPNPTGITFGAPGGHPPLEAASGHPPPLASRSWRAFCGSWRALRGRWRAAGGSWRAPGGSWQAPDGPWRA